MQRISPARNPDPNDAALYKDFDQLTGTRGSVPPARFFNDLQSELLNLITGAGLTPASGNLSQVLQAVQALISGGGAGAVTAGVLNEAQAFTASGTWTPDEASATALFLACGGGGAGGGIAAGSNDVYGGGGGGAETRLRYWVVSGSKLITIGAGGSGGANADGGNGGATTVAGLLTAAGGSGGPKAGASGLGGAAGSGGSDGILLPGSRGGGVYNAVRAGEGGGSFFGPGSVIPATSATAGAAGACHGAGGSGANGNNNSGGGALAGGAGAAGFCLILGFK